MNVLILASGLGSRLSPLTNNIPKPLLPIVNVPNLTHLYLKVKELDISTIYMNTFYKKEKFSNFIIQENLDIDIIEEEKLSGPAGCIGKLPFDKDLLILSGDGVHDIDLRSLISLHKDSNSDFTLCTQKISSSSSLGVCEVRKNKVISMQKKLPDNELVNLGVYLLSSNFLKKIQGELFEDYSDLLDYAISIDAKISNFEHKGFWKDIGSKSEYYSTNIEIAKNKMNIDYLKIKYPTIYEKITKNESEHILITDNKSSEINYTGVCIIGENVKISKGSFIENSILLPGTKVDENIVLINSILGGN